jgi:SEC-C motif-containing protein
MRSRYAAYALGKMTYLVNTWHPEFFPQDISPDPSITWIGLKINQVVNGTRADSAGTVEFVARYKVAGKAHRLHEVSQFQKVRGSWLYVNGVVC